jgi:hypothetical protein
VESSSDVSLFFSLATAIATALTAAIKLGLLDFRQEIDRVGAPPPTPHRWKRIAHRTAAAATLCAAVLGILAALIAVGKEQSEPLLTVFMFVGIVAPAAYALWATLHKNWKSTVGP